MPGRPRIRSNLREHRTPHRVPANSWLSAFMSGSSLTRIGGRRGTPILNPHSEPTIFRSKKQFDMHILASALGLLALVLTSIGLAGSIAQRVTRRTRWTR
jgi:hypothetical protein